MCLLILVAADRPPLNEAISRTFAAVEAAGGYVKDRWPLGPLAEQFLVDAPNVATLRRSLDETYAGLAVDHCLRDSASPLRKSLLIADMDSTIINVECLDELADYAGVKERVAAITERAMAGELEFEGALRERLALLEGLEIEALARCHAERVRLNPGARTLVETMKAHGARCVLVSGGFTDFTDKVAAAAGFHETRANILERADGRLTGKVREPILGREAKLVALEQEAAALGVGLDAALAVGDGANDLAMIEAAGLGVAYRAKPVVAARADARVDVADLTALLYFQGYRQEEFVQ